MRSHLSWLIAIAVATGVLLNSSRDAATQSNSASYGVTDLGTIGGAEAVALAISPDTAFPAVAGYSQTASGNEHAFAGSAFRITDLGTLGGPRSEARALIFDRVVGLSQIASGAYHAFLGLSYQSGLTDLGTLGGSQSFANAVAYRSATSSFMIVGGSETAGGATRAFFYDTASATMTELPVTLGGANAVATGVNSQGHVVGYADRAGGAPHHAFLFFDSVTQDLGSLGATSDATAVNDSDVVVGFSVPNNTSGAQHAFRYQGGLMQDLGTLGGTRSEARDVNASGVIVGWAQTAQGNPHAFIWRDGVMTDLNTVIPAGTGWELQIATGISEGRAGREAIVGYGRFNGHTRAFILTPPLDLGIQLHPHMNSLDTNIPNPHETGQRLQMGATVTNNEAFNASNVVITDTYSGPVQIDRWFGADSCTQDGLQLTCTFNRVSGAGFGKDLIVDIHATSPGVITHSAAIVSADQPDPSTGNNNAGTESNTAVSLASLTLTKTSAVGGEPVASRATLTSNAPYGGATVKLTSSRPDIATVPSQFDVLRGCCDDGMWREFYVTTRAVSEPVTVDISASYGLITKTVPLTITPSPAGSPFGGSPWTIPGTIQAENFDEGSEGTAYHDGDTSNNGGAYRSTGVDIEPTSDAGAGFDVGWMTAGEWLNYTVSVTESGSYTLKARVAANGAGGTFHVEFGGANKTGTLTIPNTGGWQAWTDVMTTVSLNAGVQSMRFVEDANGATGIFGNVNYVQLVAQSTGGPTPFGGTPRALPGTVQAEDFDEGGERVAYHDDSTGNSGAAYRSTDVDIQATSDAGGGFNVGWMSAGEWLNYTVSVAQSGSYALTTRAAADGAGGTFHVEFGGANKTGPLTIPNTGGWQVWTDITTTVSLSAGVQSMRFVADTNGSVFGNLNFIRLTALSSPPPAPTNIVLYSTDLSLHGNWLIGGDATAAGGNKVFTADNGSPTTSAPLAAPEDYFEASFDAPAATPYAIWLRIRATADSKFNESSWVQFSDARADGGAVYPIGSTSGLLVNLEACSNCGVSNWGWQNGAWWLSQATTVSFAASGRHTIRVQVREDGAQIDQILLSPSQYLMGAPGPVKNDSTIVPK